MLDLLVLAAAMLDPGSGQMTRQPERGQADVVRENSEQTRTYENLGQMADGDVMAIAFIVMMEAAKSAQEDLKSIMDGVKRLNKEKQEARDLLATMQQQQRRLLYNAKLKREQREWAYSLRSLCPPGTDQDDCLLRELRLRTAALKAQRLPERP
jgi:hypothetical protein